MTLRGAEEVRIAIAKNLASKMEASLAAAIQKAENDLCSNVRVPRPEILQELMATRVFDEKLQKYSDLGPYKVDPYQAELLEIENVVLVKLSRLGYKVNINISGKSYDVRWSA